MYYYVKWKPNICCSHFVQRDSQIYANVVLMFVFQNPETLKLPAAIRQIPFNEFGAFNRWLIRKIIGTHLLFLSSLWTSKTLICGRRKVSVFFYTDLWFFDEIFERHKRALSRPTRVGNVLRTKSVMRSFEDIRYRNVRHCRAVITLLFGNNKQFWRL